MTNKEINNVEAHLNACGAIPPQICLKANLMMVCKRKVELELKLKEDTIKADVDRNAN